MKAKERKQLAIDIESRLKNELKFKLDYNVCDYHKYGTSVVDVNIDIYKVNDRPNNWDVLVEKIIKKIVATEGGWFSWNGWCISVSIPD